MNERNDIGELILPLTLFMTLGLSSEYLHRILQVAGLDLDPAGELSLLRIIQTTMWFCGAWLTGKLIIALLLNPAIRRRTGRQAPRILANMVYASAFIATGFLVLKFVFQYQIGGLAATSGIITLIIGVAIRDMIADFFSGIAINLERPYTIGDWLELSPGLVAKVVEQNWRATRLITQAHQTVVVANNDLASRQFLNYSLPNRQYRESFDIVLNYTTDPDRAENILTAAILSTEGLAEDCDHQVRIKGFEERGVIYQIRFWISDFSDKVRLRHRVAANVLKFLNQAGIPIPYAQHEIVMTRRRRPRREPRIAARRLLSRIDWLEPLNDAELETIASVAIGCEFAKGEEICREGDTGTSLYLVVEGIAEASTTNPAGAMVKIGQIEPGNAVGEMSVLTGEPRGATVRAVTNIYALQIRQDDLLPVLRERPEIAIRLGKIMAARTRANQALPMGGNAVELDNTADSLAAQIARKITTFFGLH